MKKPGVLAVIPARLRSTRFSGKVLYPFRGKPLLYWVWREVRRCSRIDRLVVATDDREVHQAAEAFGAEVMRTSARHRTGTDRVAEVAEVLGGKLIINVQADNLGLKHAVLNRVIDRMNEHPAIPVATLARRIETDDELFNPGLVKVIISETGEALWFSRYPLPYLQGADGRRRAGQFGFYAHIGVYFFRRAALRAFARSRRTALERAESLEQLRILERGGRIRVFKTAMRSVSVDRPEDVKKLTVLYK
ncbi:MAG TPA: 3-deoxy-manno-octulosonate cytidylyltransferase [Acidobacteriota bacterium]|nr:3-deoxy-manno-octulosonate cytidylyltransferase [Acidobacteriota bacterium]